MPPAPLAAPSLRTLLVKDFRRVTADAALLTLDLGSAAFPFRAGQAAWLGLHGHPLRKPYSMAVSPREAARTGLVSFLIGLEDDGLPGEHLTAAAPGMPVDVDGPVGTFVVPPLPDAPHCLFVAGGTGIAPLRAMLHETFDERPHATASVVYSARSLAHVAFRDELTALQRTGRIRLDITLTRQADAAWVGAVGRVTHDILLTHVGETTYAFVCGPGGFVDHVTPLLVAASVVPDKIYKEDW